MPGAVFLKILYLFDGCHVRRTTLGHCPHHSNCPERLYHGAIEICSISSRNCSCKGEVPKDYIMWGVGERIAILRK